MEVVPLSTGAVAFAPLRSSLHPSLRITVNTTSPSTVSEASSSKCKLRLELSLPDALFIDRDELRDNLRLLDWTLEPDVIDLERPVRSGLPLSLLRLSPSKKIWDEEGMGTLEMQMKIPLHARYLEPEESGRKLVWLFAGGDAGELRGGWVCGLTTDQPAEFALVPSLPLSLDLPTGRPSHQNLIEIGTTLTVWLCFVYLAYKVWRTYQRLRVNGTKTL